MQQRALVIRTYGNQELAKSMALTLESSELKKLRAQLGVKAPREKNDCRKKIIEARKKYKIKPISPFKRKIWGIIGLVILLANGGIN